MRAQRITLVLIAAAAATVPAAATTATAAPPPPRVATDHTTGLAFSLQGKRITLKLTGRKAAAAKLVRGRQVRVSCGTKQSLGKPNSRQVARGSGVWSRRATKRTFTLSRNIATRASWCLVAADNDIAGYVDLKLGRNPRESVTDT